MFAGMLECARAFTGLRRLRLGCEVIMDYRWTSAAWRYLAENASATLTHVTIIGVDLTPEDQRALDRFEVDLDA